MDSFKLESAIIGSLVRYGEKCGKLFQMLSPEDFAEPLHQDMFACAHSLFKSGAPVNLTTLKHKLMTAYDSNADEAMVESALESYALAATGEPEHYAALLREAVDLEELRSKGSALAFASTLEDARNMARELALKSVSSAKSEVKTALNAALDFADALDAAAEKPPEYLDWGIPALNDALTSELGDFVIIGGRPSAGKTMFALQAALRLARSYRVGFVSLETSPAKLTRRAMSHLSGVPLWKLKKPWTLTADDHKALTAAEQAFSRLSLEIADRSVRSTAQIEATAINRRWEVVIVDYIQICQGKGSSRYETVTNISQELHTMAQTHGICVIGLAQLSRGVKNASGRESSPTLESLRESGQLEQDADAVMLLYLENSEDTGGNRLCKIAKNKEGELAIMTLLFNGETQTFIYTRGD